MDKDNKIVIDATGNLQDVLVIKFNREGGWNNTYEIPLEELIETHFLYRDLEVNYECLLNEIEHFKYVLEKTGACLNRNDKNDESNN